MFPIALNDLRLLFRDKAAAFFTFLFPLLFAIFFSFVFKTGGGGGGKMTVAVFDEDATEASARLIADLQADTALETKIVESRKAGTELVRKSDATALIVVPKGFAQGADGMFTGGKIPLEAVVDPSRTAEAGLLTGKLNELAFRQLSTMFTDNRRMKSMLDKSREQLRTFAPDGSPRSEAFLKFFEGADGLSAQLEQIQKEAEAKSPVTKPGKEPLASTASKAPSFNPVDVKITQLAVDEPGANGEKKDSPRRSTDFSFPQGIAWGLMGCVIGFAASLASERRRGTLIRLTTAPITKAQILGGKALACFIACMAVQVMLIGVAVVMGSHVWSWPTLIVAILSASIGFVGMAMLLAALAGSEEGAGGMARAVPMILAMIGGGTIPLFAMPPFVKTLSNISPFKWAIYAVEGGMWRGFSPIDMLLPCGILIGLGVVCFAIGVKRLKWE